MPRRDNRTRLGYMAFVLGWLGYTSLISAGPLGLESTPLFLKVQSSPNIIFMIDDSGSMNWEVITGDFAQDGRYTGTQRDGSSPKSTGKVMHRYNSDDTTGKSDCRFGSPFQSFNGYAYGVDLPSNTDVPLFPAYKALHCNTADDEEWRFRNHDFNPLYFDPKQTYLPWAGVDAKGNKFKDMKITAARDNPYDPNSRTLDLTQNNSQGDPNIMSYRNDPTKKTPDGFRYYTWNGARDAKGKPIIFNDGEETVHFIKDEPENQQNFANWFSYYRKREYVVKAVYGQIITNPSLANFRVGLVTLHNNENQSPFSVNGNVKTINTPLKSIAANKDVLLDALYSFHAQGDTPLRNTLQKIGEYLEDTSERTLFPNDHDAYLTADKGGACQQSFVILMTDGLERGTPSSVGNADNSGGSDGLTKFNGGPYADKISNTLADVAMHYYQRDLRSTLDDMVPINIKDQARHQHMVTYTVTFNGFDGSLPEDDPKAPIPPPDGLTFWPDPTCIGCNPRFKIDDLRHAAFNGRGQFLQANDPTSLLDALQSALNNIVQRTSSAASVALTTGSLSATSRLFQASFDSGNWSGDLVSIKLDPITGAPSPNPQDRIHARDLLEQRLKAQNYDTSVRTILTYKPSTASGIPFQWSQLDPGQQGDLDKDSKGKTDNKGEARLNYLRGSNVDEAKAVDEAEANKFRKRDYRLGDLINSDPFFVGPPAFLPPFPANVDPTGEYVKFRDDPTNHNRMKMILVGGNDGMLHIFNANDPQLDANSGQEVLAYLPNSVLENTVDLTSDPYRHRYYVDGSPTARDVLLSQGWRTVAVGGLRGGGQGYFALDITDPTRFDEAHASERVLWEFTDLDDPDLGFTFSQPSLVRMADGNWYAVFGNGYNNAAVFGKGYNNADDASRDDGRKDPHTSTTGDAVFFIVRLDGPNPGGWKQGKNYFKIKTNVGDTVTPNGLATPAIVDVDGDFTMDYLVAGDLLGNLWRVDVRSKNPADWEAPKNLSLLFQTRQDVKTKTRQPVTSRPEVGKHPDNFGGFVVYFGTGKYLELADSSPTGATTQTFYGIWDKPDPATGALDACPSPTPCVKESELVRQTVITASAPLTVTDTTNNQQRTVNIRVTSDNPIGWKPEPGGDRGFRLDLPAPGEKQVSDSILRNGRIIFSTLIPNDQPCSAGGTSFIMALDVHGGRPVEPFFDINKDKLFNDQDKEPSTGIPFNGLESSVGIVKTPTLQASGATDTASASGTGGNVEAELVNPGSAPVGRQAWRKITQ